MPGSTAQTNKFHTFYLQQRPDNGDTWADIKVNHPLDYESIKEYNLTIRVEVSVKQYSYLSQYIFLILICAFSECEWREKFWCTYCRKTQNNIGRMQQHFTRYIKQ